MNTYSIALVSHMVGALGFFAALGMEWLGIWQMQRAATDEQVHKWMRLSSGARNVSIAFMAAILISGLYTAATAWGHVWWTMVALGALVLLYIPAAVLTGRRLAEIKRMLAAEKGTVSPALHHRLQHPLLRISIQIRVAIALGILFLMNNKPNLSEALLTMGIAVILGLASSLPLPRPQRMREKPAE